MRILITATALGLTIFMSGCLNWQESYNRLARADCTKLIDDRERQECLTAVERNASEKRKEQREREAGRSWQPNS